MFGKFEASIYKNTPASISYLPVIKPIIYITSYFGDADPSKWEV
jgi:hypothetical protein